MAKIMERASALASLLRLVGRAQENLDDAEDQNAVGWLLPVAERLAAEIAAISEDELDRPRSAGVEVQS